MSITIVGLGPAHPNQMTVEAATLLADIEQRQKQETVLVYGLAHVRSMVSQRFPMIKLNSLDYLYSLPGVDRPTAYRDLAQMLLNKSMLDGFEVIYLVAGSPLYYNDAVRLIRLLCQQAGHPLRLIHGMAFVELVLEAVDWTGHRGLQLYSAWNIADDSMVLQPDAPALLCQIGEHSSSGDAVDARQSVGMLTRLKQGLLKCYPQDHQVVVLHTEPPDYIVGATELLLRELDRKPVPVYANLWVPPLDASEEGRVFEAFRRELPSY